MLSPQHIIAFFGDTNYINHAQIRYVCEINHSPSGATRPRVSRFISVYVPIGHDLSNTHNIAYIVVVLVYLFKGSYEHEIKRRFEEFCQLLSALAFLGH